MEHGWRVQEAVVLVAVDSSGGGIVVIMGLRCLNDARERRSEATMASGLVFMCSVLGRGGYDEIRARANS